MRWSVSVTILFFVLSVCVFVFPTLSAASVCGDGIIEPGETCDGMNWGNITNCSAFGEFQGGTLSCNPVTCLFNTSACTGLDPCAAAMAGTQTIVDASEPIPASVDIVNATLTQYNEALIADLYLAGNPLPYDGCYKIIIDADQNASTGDPRGPLGVDYFVVLCGNGSNWEFHVDTQGGGRHDMLLNYSLNGSHLRMAVTTTPLNTTSFLWSFESFNSLSNDLNNEVREFILAPASSSLTITSPNLVETAPPLIAVPYQGSAQLTVQLTVNGQNQTINPGDVMFQLTHPVSNRIPDPSSIISVNTTGVAHYQSPGYVFAIATLAQCSVYSEKVILATGEFYGSGDQNVVAVFPAGYTPNGSSFSFGDMLSQDPDMVAFLDKAYGIESSLYSGFRPSSNGLTGKQVLALLDLPGHCGGNNNPLEVAPCCYMNCGDGTPMYNVPIHEMGHNFATSRGMSQFLLADNARFATAGLGECVASLPVIYIAGDASAHPEQYGLENDSFELTYYRDFLNSDKPYAAGQLAHFEDLIRNGNTTGFFDNNGTFDGVSTMCSFFQGYAYNFTTANNPYGNEVIRRFLKLFPDEDLQNFRNNESETYFAAAYSTAVGDDMRTQLRAWGFTIDDEYFEELYLPPVIANLSPNGTLAVGTTSAQLAVVTAENATCKYDVVNTSFANMTFNLSTNDGQTHTAIVTVANGGVYAYYIRCNNPFGNMNNVSIIISFAVASPASGGGGGGGGGGGAVIPSGGDVSQAWLDLGAGQEVRFSVNRANLSVTNITFTVTQATSQLGLSLSGGAGNSAPPPAPAGVQTYQLTQVVSGNADTIGTGFTLAFKIDKLWLSQNHITAVILYRLENGAWRAYTPTQTGEDSTYAYYSASLPGLSLFLIGGTTATPMPAPSNATTSPSTPAPAANVTNAAPVFGTGTSEMPPTPAKTKSSLVVWLLLGGLILLIIGGLIMLFFRQQTKPADDLSHHLALLRQFIEQQVAAGHAAYDVEQAVLKAGWPGHFVEQTFHSLNIPWRDPNEASTAKQRMAHPHEPLRDYIDKCLDKGVPLEKIREVLLNAGWKREKIEPVLREYAR